MEDITHHLGSLVGMVGALQMLSGCFYLFITRSWNFIMPSKCTHAITVILSLLTLVPLLVATLNVFVVSCSML